jgi:hypothetical protein
MRQVGRLDQGSISHGKLVPSLLKPELAHPSIPVRRAIREKLLRTILLVGVMGIALSAGYFSINIFYGCLAKDRCGRNPRRAGRNLWHRCAKLGDQKIVSKRLSVFALERLSGSLKEILRGSIV